MKHYRRSIGEIAGTVSNYMFLLTFSLICLIPFLYVVMVSISSEKSLAHYGSSLIPKELSFSAYQFLFSYSRKILLAYGATVYMAGAGTIIGLAVTAGLAYPMSRKDLPFRNTFMKYVLFSMLFGGGLIPFYLVINKLGLYNTFWSLILPGCYSSWNMILMRNYFMSIPSSLEESALIDGANEIQILYKIILPLSKPIMATIGLFIAVGFWNSWFSALLFLEDTKKWPIMMFLKEVIQSSRVADKMVGLSQATYPPSECLKMAVVVVCTVPILCAYPFIQKYFVRGIMIGSIKG